MEENLYKCKNCDSPIPPELALEIKFNICPGCGKLYPQTIEYLENYFRIVQLSKELKSVRELLLKSETNASVREALIKFETIVRKKSGLKDCYGKDLMAKAFSFKMDSNKRKIIEEPKIKVNNLSTISKRNEQEGIKLLAMGLMQGIRNIYMHSEGAHKLFYCIQIITLIDLILKQILGWESIATCSE